MERGNEVFLLEGKFSCSSDLLSDVKQPHFLLVVSLPDTFCEGTLWRALKGTSLKYAGMSVPGEAPLFLVTQASACCFWDSVVQQAAISGLQARQFISYWVMSSPALWKFNLALPQGLR